MARATYADLVTEVRAQVDVDAAQAKAWLIDRARVLNAESAWRLVQAEWLSTGERTYPLPADCLWVEAVLVDGFPYRRSTLKALDVRWSGVTGATIGVYADAADPAGSSLIQIHPVAEGSTIVVRYTGDIDDQAASPPFPPDFDAALIEGAIAIGLARMDERFDSAGYFDARFVDAVGRLRRRRHGHVGRGATAIRVAQ